MHPTISLLNSMIINSKEVEDAVELRLLRMAETIEKQNEK